MVTQIERWLQYYETVSNIKRYSTVYPESVHSIRDSAQHVVEAPFGRNFTCFLLNGGEPQSFTFASLLIFASMSMCLCCQHEPNLCPAVTRPLVSVQTVSMLSACFSIPADAVNFVHTNILTVGRLIVEGTLALPVTPLLKSQWGSVI